MSSASVAVTEMKGDLFALAPENSILIHACNTRGSWGAGIAKSFLEKYPAAFHIYKSHCKSNTASYLLSTTLLIPPQPNDARKHWIACLFTSIDYGRRKGNVQSILDATKDALKDLSKQVEELRKEEGETKPGELWGCRFNSGKFGVPWEKSRTIVEELGMEMTVVESV